MINFILGAMLGASVGAIIMCVFIGGKKDE